MNGTLLKSCALFASLLLAASPAFAKKKPVDLSAFKGNYSGTLVLTQGPLTAAGTSSVSLAPAKNGKTATLTFQGAVTTGDSTLPVSTSIVLKTNGTSSTSNILIGIAGISIPATGTAHLGKDNFTFAFSIDYSGTPISLSGTGTVKDAGKKRHLTLNLNLAISDTGIAFNSVLTAKAPKK
jgi:hypothetical protein